MKIPIAELVKNINSLLTENRLTKTKLCRLNVPMRFGGSWFLLMCDIGSERCDRKVFDEWDQNKVRFIA